MAAWASASDAQQEVELAPGHRIARLAQDDRIEPLFGLPLGEWQRAERRELAKLIGKCRKEAARARNKELKGQLTKARRAVDQAIAMYRRLRQAQQREQRQAERERQREEQLAAQARQRSTHQRQRLEQALEQDFGRLPPGEERDRAYGEVLRILDGKEPSKHGYRNRRINDLLAWIQSMKAGLQDDDRLALRARAGEIRQRKAAEGEQQLAAAKQELAMLQPDKTGYARINELKALPALSLLPPKEAQASRRAVSARQQQWAVEKRQLQP